MSQWDYKIDQPMPGPFPFPNLRKGPGIEVDAIFSQGRYRAGQNSPYTAI